MVIIVERVRQSLSSADLKGMFEARKRVFVDLLGWDVPVLDGRFEIDQFDDEHAVYLIVTDADGRHAASARLLPTTRAHILDSLFPQLCQTSLPRGPHVMEITCEVLTPRCPTNGHKTQLARSRSVTRCNQRGVIPSIANAFRSNIS